MPTTGLAAIVTALAASLGAGCGCDHTAYHITTAISADALFENYVSPEPVALGSWVTEGNVYAESIGLVWFIDDTTTNGIAPIRHDDLICLDFSEQQLLENCRSALGFFICFALNSFGVK